MWLASLLTNAEGATANAYVYAKAPAAIIVVVLAMSYLAIVAVALFHPDEKRRADARTLLKYHRFTRKPKSR
jgi:hypothetical protein